MSEVKSLFGDVIIQREANPDVIRALRQILEMAEAGEVVGFANVCLHCDETASSNIVGSFNRSVLGTVVVVEHKLAELLR